jgi:hypothetical protein
MWQCHTYGPEVTGRNAGCAVSGWFSGSPWMPGRAVTVLTGSGVVVFHLPSQFAMTVVTSPGNV